jgi:hypothetical protein
MYRKTCGRNTTWFGVPNVRKCAMLDLNQQLPPYKLGQTFPGECCPVGKSRLSKQFLAFSIALFFCSVRVRPAPVAAWLQHLTILRPAPFPPTLSRFGSALRIMVHLFAEVWRERARLRVRLRRLRPSVRLALLSVLSGIFGGFPGGRAAEDLNGPLVLLGGDLASGEALPEDFLR